MEENSENTWRWQAAAGKILLLSVIFLCSLGIRVYLLGERWVNPDEGAHLMDAMLVLEGKIPIVDFSSRQPVYVYANALVLNMFGVNLTAGRMLPLVCSLLTGVVIFLIARRVFNDDAAVLSTIIWWLLPLEVMNSVVVKTQPLNTLLICCSVFLMIRSLQGGSAAGWWSSGAFAAVAFYVRQSALIVPLMVLVVFLSLFFRRKATMLREILAFFGGFAVVVLIVLLFYSKFVTWWELLGESFNPIGFLFKAILKTLGVTGEAAMGSVYGQASEHAGGETPLYIGYVIAAVILHLFLFAGLGLSIIQLGLKRILHQRIKAEPMTGSLILHLWFFGLVIAYVYYFLTRGFFIDYSREVIPPLVILFAGWAVNMFGGGNGLNRWIKLLCVALLPAVVGFFLSSVYPGFSKALQLLVVCLCTFAVYLLGEAQTPGVKPKLAALSAAGLVIGFGLCHFQLSKIVSWSASAALLAIVYGSGLRAIRGTCKIDAGAWGRAVCLSVVAGSLSLSITHSVDILDRRYDSIWSPQSLREVADLISSNSGIDEQVMSGGVIWEFEAGRRPFLMISHPLVNRDRMQEKDRQFVGKALRDSPPKIIVQDGYTELTYFQYFPWIEGLLEQRYRVIHTAGPARFPVIVYLRIDG